MLPMTNRLAKDALDRPSAIDSRLQRLLLQAQVCGPRLDTHRETVMGQARLLVPGLLGAWNPFRVARFVVAIHIHTLNRVSGWAWPHVGKELSKVCQPLRAHLNAAATVILVFGQLLIQAAIAGVLPSVVLAAGVALSVVSVEKVSLGRDLTRQTTATHLTGPQRLTPDSAGITAFASTGPCQLATESIWRQANNRETAEGLSSEVDSAHSVFYTRNIPTP